MYYQTLAYKCQLLQCIFESIRILQKLLAALGYLLLRLACAICSFSTMTLASLASASWKETEEDSTFCILLPLSLFVIMSSLAHKSPLYYIQQNECQVALLLPVYIMTSDSCGSSVERSWQTRSERRLLYNHCKNMHPSSLVLFYFLSVVVV